MAILDMSILNSPVAAPKSLDTMTTMLEAEDTSFFSQAVDFLIENERMYNAAVKDLYQSITEASDLEAINESFDDFKTKAKKVLDTFLAFLKSLFQRFMTAIKSITKDDNYLKAHLKDLDKFPADKSFEFEGYEFTIEKEVPLTDPQSEWIDDVEQSFKDMIVPSKEELHKNAGSRDYEEIQFDRCKKIVDGFVNKISDGDYFDSFRAAIMGRKGETVDSSEFASFLFKNFRNNNNDKISIKVDKAKINEIKNDYNSIDQLKSDTEKARTTIETAYKNMVKEVTEYFVGDFSDIFGAVQFGDVKYRAISDKHDVGYIDKNSSNKGKLIAQMNRYKKAKLDQLQGMTSIHMLALSAKLDAIRDMAIQDKTILYKAVNMAQANIKDSKKEEGGN